MHCTGIAFFLFRFCSLGGGSFNSTPILIIAKNRHCHLSLTFYSASTVITFGGDSNQLNIVFSIKKAMLFLCHQTESENGNHDHIKALKRDIPATDWRHYLIFKPLGYRCEPLTIPVVTQNRTKSSNQ